MSLIEREHCTSVAKRTDSVVHDDTWLKVSLHHNRHRSRRFRWVRVRDSIIGVDFRSPSRRTRNSSGSQPRRRRRGINRSTVERTSEDRPGFQNPKRLRQHSRNPFDISFRKKQLQAYNGGTVLLLDLQVRRKGSKVN